MLIGYARVSSDDQNLNLQKDALTRAGCERILEDRQKWGQGGSAGIERRPRLCTGWGYADGMATGSAQPISQGSY